MRFVSCIRDGRRHAALVDGDVLVPLAGIDELGAATPISVLADPPLVRTEAFPRDQATLRAVVPQPGKVICVGLNYRTHVEESGRTESSYPVLFTKFASSLTGPYDPIPLPPESAQPDYEGEIAVVIGSPARRVGPHDAMRHVAGLSIANDVTMRDFQFLTHQWLPGKAWDATNPLGPELVTLDEVPEPAEMQMTVRYDDMIVQQATADLLIFPIAELVSTISAFTALLPGDVILTGTPGGVGNRREPPLYLQPGHRISVEVTGLGRIDNEIAVEDLSASATRKGTL